MGNKEHNGGFTNYRYDLRPRKILGIYSGDPLTEFSVPGMESLIALVKRDSTPEGEFLDKETSLVFTSKLVDMHPYSSSKPTILTMKGYPIVDPYSYYGDYLSDPNFNRFNVVGTSLFSHENLARRSERTLYGQMLTIARGAVLINKAVERSRETGQKIYVIAGSQGGTAAIYHALTSNGEDQADLYFPLTTTTDYSNGLLKSLLGRLTVNSRGKREKMQVYQNAFIRELPDDPILKEKMFPVISRADHVIPGQLKFWKGYQAAVIPWGHSTESAKFGKNIIPSWVLGHIS